MKTVLVTGASRGIGRVTCQMFAEKQFRVLAVARSREDLEELARTTPGVEALPVDLSRPESVEALGQTLKEKGWEPEILINNAGFGMRAAIEESPSDGIRKLFEVNLFSVLRLTQLVLPAMRQKRRGCIVNISSVAGQTATPFGGIYSASKFALEASTDALRLETRPWGIRVVLVEPGPVKTDFVNAAAKVSDPVLDRQDSAYSRYYQLLKESVDWVHSRAVTADAVAEVILRASLSPRPRARYAVHKAFFYVPILLRRAFPTAVLDSVLAKRMQLNTPAP